MNVQSQQKKSYKQGKVCNMFKTNSKYKTPERRQVDDDFSENFGTNVLSRSSALIVNFEHVITVSNKLIFN